MRYNDILFFNLHRRYLNQQFEYGGFLGIYILAAFLNRNGYSAQGYDGGLVEGKRILDEACRERKVRMIGLYCDYENVTENVFISRYIKENYHLPVIVGGPQSTSLGVDFFSKSKCDAIVRYEGEITVLELMDLFLEKIGRIENILGVSYFTVNGIVINKERPVIQNLDSIPFINDECYLEPERRYQGLSIMTGRGCPFHCAFCHEGHHTRQVRFRSIENVLQEIDLFLRYWPEDRTLFILFTDDTFTLHPNRLKAICMGLKERRQQRDFQWFCEGHVHTLYQHPEMIRYIAVGGAYRIQLGIEAGTQSVLDAYNKNTTIEEIETVVQWCKDAELEVYGNIILAGAFYTASVYEKNLTFAKKILSMGQGCAELGVVSFWPLPETQMTMHPEHYDLEVIDNEFLTSVGDFPQVETSELNKWDISIQMQNMEKELKEHMTRMIENWEVPTSRVLKWFTQNDKSSVYGLWYRCLAQNEVLFSYYSFLYSGEAVSSDDFNGDIDDAHPIRVIEIYNHLRQIDDNEVEYCDCFLRGFEREILPLTTGKLSVKEIVEYLRSKSFNVTHSQVTDVLMRLEKHHLIVWSRY